MPPSTPDVGVGAAVEAAVLKAYTALPKHGKPQAHEYTLLAGFATADTADNNDNPDALRAGPCSQTVFQLNSLASA